MPLATLVNATKPPQQKGDAILSPQGLKRFFVVHGGLFSKDDVTLDDIRKIDRIGRQPGQEGILCKSICLFPKPNQLISCRRGTVFQVAMSISKTHTLVCSATLD